MKRIEFYSDINGVAETWPISRPTEHIPRWVNLVQNDYKQSDKLQSHLYRCPGIFELYKTGFILPAWHDIKLTTDGENYGWLLPNDELKQLVGSHHIAKVHSHKTIARYLPRPPWSHPSVLKLNTPWHIVAPRGVKFLITAFPYPDSYEFESVNGILDPSISSELNVQLNYNVVNGVHIIKAGTPLAHIIPLTERNYDFVVRDATAWDRVWSKKREYLNNMSFVINRTRMKEAYERHFHGKKCPFHFWRR